MSRQTKLQIWKDHATDHDYMELKDAYARKDPFPTDTYPFSQTSARKILIEKRLIENVKKDSSQTPEKIFHINESLVDDDYTNTSILLSGKAKSELDDFYKDYRMFNRKLILNQIILDGIAQYKSK